MYLFPYAVVRIRADRGSILSRHFTLGGALRAYERRLPGATGTTLVILSRGKNKIIEATIR